MPIIGINCTPQTKKMLQKIINTKPEFRELKGNLDLSDDTFFARLAIINLLHNPPPYEDVKSYKAALIRPNEFDSYLHDF